MVTEVKKAIRTNAAWAADQAAMEALYGVGGYYTTLTAWEAAQQGDLVTADEIRVAECYDDWPSGLSDSFVIAGSTTDATRYLKITVASGHRHNGIPQTGFHIKKSLALDRLIYNQVAYTVLDYLDVENTDSGGIAIESTVAFTAQNCIAKGGTSRQAFRNCTGGQSFYSCLAWGGGSGFLCIGYQSPTLYNSAAVNCTTGFDLEAGTGDLLKNCLAYNNTTNYAGSYSSSSSNNASSSASGAPGTSAVHSVTSAAFVNSAASPPDMHLASGSALIGAGTNLYSTFTTDIDGDTWPSGGAWDIGFDYYVSSGTNVSLSGVTGTGAIGSLSQQISPNITLASALATGAIGSFSFTSVPVISLTGTQATGAVGSLSTTASADVTLTGTQATGAIGSLTVNTSGSTSVNLTGVQAASNVGTFTFNVSPNVSLTGVQALGQVGTASVITGMVITPTGVSATGAVGTITTRADVTLTLSSVSASGQVGSVTVGGVGVSVALSGVAASSAVGAITVTTQNTGWTDIALSGGTWTVQGAASSIWTDLTGD